jgi:hypothetical protein
MISLCLHPFPPWINQKKNRFSNIFPPCTIVLYCTSTVLRRMPFWFCSQDKEIIRHDAQQGRNTRLRLCKRQLQAGPNQSWVVQRRLPHTNIITPLFASLTKQHPMNVIDKITKRHLVAFFPSRFGGRMNESSSSHSEKGQDQ